MIIFTLDVLHQDMNKKVPHLLIYPHTYVYTRHDINWELLLLIGHCHGTPG